MRFWLKIFSRPWIWSYLGALLVWLAAIAFTHGYGAGGMLTAGLALAVFSVITGVAQMFVITLGPGNVDPSLPANIGLASAVAMKVMGGSDKMIICKAVEERICRKIDLASRDDLTLQQAVDALLLLLKIVRQNNLSVDISSAEKLLLSRSI